LIVQAASQAAHAVLAARGRWVTNEKTLITGAGLDEIDQLVADTHPDHLAETVESAHALCSEAVRRASG
jgi:hypothetical protein